MIILNKENCGLYDLKTSTYLIKPTSGSLQHRYEYDGSKYVEIKRCSGDGFGSVDHCNRVVLVGGSTELMNSGVLHSACKGLKPKEFNMPKITLVEGVPGCGKTHYVLNELKFGTDLVLFPTREGRLDFPKRYLADHPGSNQKTVNSDFRTVDSYLINGPEKLYKRLIVDEALMLHAGQIMYSILKSGVTEVVLVGDTHQIPCINRTPKCEVIYGSIAKFCTEIKYLNVSYRCTNTVAALFTGMYKTKGMKSTSRVRNDMTVEPYQNITSDIIGLWRNAHTRCVLTDRGNGVQMTVMYQRKSGDASTYLGNTMLLMAVIATLFDLSKCDFALFSGDDLIIVGGDIDHDRNELCALMFNLK